MAAFAEPVVRIRLPPAESRTNFEEAKAILLQSLQEKPNWAPTWEYVAIPLGSSSEAPVIRPGPNLFSKDKGDWGAPAFDLARADEDEEAGVAEASMAERLIWGASSLRS